MNDALLLLAECRKLGIQLTPTPEGKLLAKASGPLPESLRDALKCLKAEVLALLTHPYLNEQDELVIPFACDARYLWWKSGGQRLRATLKELGASAEVVARYCGQERHPGTEQQESGAQQAHGS